MDKKRTILNDMNNESDRQFLDRTGVTTQMQEVITKIIENRPEDPIGFLADFFETVGDKNDRVTKAHQQVSLTHHSKPAFHNNVRIAYDLLSQTKAGRQLKGITGNAYTELLNLLTQPFPLTVKEKLMKKIQCRDYELVVFDVFKSGVFTCLVLQDFIRQSQMLFKSLDTQRSSKVDKVLCDIILQQLTKAVANTDHDKPSSVLEAAILLGPEKLYSSIATTLYNNKANSNKVFMTPEDFTTYAAETFLSKVQSLK